MRRTGEEHHHDDDVVVIGRGGAAFEVSQGDGVCCSGEDLGIADANDKFLTQLGDVELPQSLCQSQVLGQPFESVEIAAVGDETSQR